MTPAAVFLMLENLRDDINERISNNMRTAFQHSEVMPRITAQARIDAYRVVLDSIVLLQKSLPPHDTSALMIKLLVGGLTVTAASSYENYDTCLAKNCSGYGPTAKEHDPDCDLVRCLKEIGAMT